MLAFTLGFFNLPPPPLPPMRRLGEPSPPMDVQCQEWYQYHHEILNANNIKDGDELLPQIPYRSPETPLLEEETCRVLRVEYETQRYERIRQQKPYYVYNSITPTTWTREDYELQKYTMSRREPRESVLVPTEEDENHVSSTETFLLRSANLNTAQLRRDMLPMQRVDRWWIVADTKAMLDDVKFMIKLLKSDKECRLRIPCEVLHDLGVMSKRHNPSFKRRAARRVSRYMTHYEKRYRTAVGQSAIDVEDLLDTAIANDSIVNCCLQQARHFFYVVLISDNPDRRLRAQSVGLPAYSLQEARDLTTTAINPLDDRTITRCYIEDDDDE